MDAEDPSVEIDAPPTTTAEQDRATAAARKIAEVAPPTTTRADDLRAAGQRIISNKWETTQQIIALMWSGAACGVCVLEIWRNSDRSNAALTLMSGTLGVVIGFYFSRTNHQRVGGVGGDQAGTR